MYQSKSLRKLFYVDTLSMFSVLLILVFFLIVSAKPLQRCPIVINLPTAHSFNTVDLDADNGTILIGEGKIMFELQSAEVREDALKQMGKMYNIAFSKDDVAKFGKTDFIGTPLGSLKKYVVGYYNFTDYRAQPGLLSDVSCGDELSNWIRCAKKATVDQHNTQLNIAIAADGKTPYPVIKNIINLLQMQRINRFTIIYSFI